MTTVLSEQPGANAQTHAFNQYSLLLTGCRLTDFSLGAKAGPFARGRPPFMSKKSPFSEPKSPAFCRGFCFSW